jgi:hypothetical protein
VKFKPIIEEYRRWEWPSDVYANLEYLANALSRMQRVKDSDYERKTNVMISSHVDGIKQ